MVNQTKNIAKLPYDIIGYINDIKEKEEKLDKIEKQQRKNHKYVINELKTNFYNVFKRNCDIVRDDSNNRNFVSVIDYLNIRKEEFEYEQIENFHYLQQIEGEVKEDFYPQVIKQLNKESFYNHNKECLKAYFIKQPDLRIETVNNYVKYRNNYIENFEYYFFMK
tara:strand:+ start:106 stop:600 length:495 start_codon:yes stop_codon:yes gene_type:complete